MDQLLRLKAVHQQLKQERDAIHPQNVNLYSAVALAEEQIAYAVALLEKRQQAGAKQQMGLVMITDQKTAASGKDE